MSLTPETPVPPQASASPAPMANAVGPATHAILRIGAALLMMPHGAQKLFGAFGKEPVSLLSDRGFAGVVEFFGSLLLLVGLASRPAAALLCFVMIAAYVVGHAGANPWPILNKGELALVYALIFAFLAANGPGPFSLDAWLRRRRDR